MNQTVPLEHKEKTAQFIWTGFILFFFLIQAVIWIVAITLTSHDPSHAVIAGYDQKALLWDQEKALRNASHQLGWHANLQIDPTTDITSQHTITLQLEQADRSPVENATITLKAFHRARAGDPQEISLTETGAGTYSGKIVIRKSGNWQFDGVALAGEDVFLIEQTQHLSASK